MKIKSEEKGTKVILHIEGDIDMHNASMLSTSLQDLIANKTQGIVVNLGDTGYLDSSGIATLVDALRKVREYDGSFVLANLNDGVKPIFEIMRLEKVFQIADSVDEAVEMKVS